MRIVPFEMSLLGIIGEFDVNVEEFTSYAERMEQYFIANDIVDAVKKRAIFLSVMGPRAYKLIRSLSQNNPAAKTFDELKQLMGEHLNPKPNVIAERYRFFKRDRKAAESVNQYVAELRKLT